MTAESTTAAAHRDPGDPKYIVPAAKTTMRRKPT